MNTQIDKWANLKEAGIHVEEELESLRNNLDNDDMIEIVGILMTQIDDTIKDIIEFREDN